MGKQFAVCHLQRGDKSGSGLSCHIERQTANGKPFIPENADQTLTYLNRELITFPEGVHGRREAIQYRLQNAGLKRKIGRNQTTHICAILTGSHDQMMKLVEEGKLDEWCQENLKSLYKMFSRENVVSCVLHMDEKTPHLHATIIPIVNTPRKRREREGVAKYNVNNDGPRLSCDDVMSRANLAKYQDIYGEVMKPFGLERGIVGSEAKHMANDQYYKKQAQELHCNVEYLASQAEELAKQNEEAKDNGIAKMLSWVGGGELTKARKIIRDQDEVILKLKKQNLDQKTSHAQEIKELKSQKFNIDQLYKSVVKENESKDRQLTSSTRIIKRQELQLQAERQPDKQRLTNMELREIGEFGGHFRLYGEYASVPFALSLTSEMDRAKEYGLNAFELSSAYLSQILSIDFGWNREEAENPQFRNSVVSVFVQLINQVTTPTCSGGGGGGSSDHGWDGKNPEELERDYLRRMFRHAYDIVKGGGYKNGRKR